MLLDILTESVKLLFSFDKELYFIIYTTLKVTIVSTFVSAIISIPLAIFIDLTKPEFKKLMTALFNSMLSMPTVVIGLFVYMLFSNAGPMGFCKLLFTPTAIIIGQTILAIPIITSLLLAGFSKTDVLLQETLITLGASKIEMVKALALEHKALILFSILGGFGRVISEVGVAMMLGGNIKWYTRTMTTAIALETGKGEFALGLALGIILLIIAVFINFFAHFILKTEAILRR
jgi:tungstate transport system permease protein